MNKEEILATKPGSDRKLDSLVHEQIMHRTIPTDHDITSRFCDCVPRYSTDISSAWEVVEEMKDKGWQFTLYTGIDLESDYCGGSKVNAVFSKPKHYIKAGVDATPEAICKAALITKLDASVEGRRC